jgi:hypothetical protein
MGTLISERVKVDLGLAPAALNNTNATGGYFAMRDFSRALAVLEVSTMAATETAKVEFLQATDAAGTGAKAVTGSDATATANTLAAEVTVDTTAGANTNTVTVNGVVFTQAAATDATKREFQNAAGLVTCVNDATYGVPNVLAAADGAVVTLSSSPAGETAITVSGHANFVLATTKMLVYSEIHQADLDAAGGFYFVAPKATVTSNSTVSVALVRGDFRDAIAQTAGASAT